MIKVLDVSAAIEILFQKEKSEKFSDEFNSGSWIIAPDLYVSEISNVVWKYYKAKVITHDECIQYVDDGINMIDNLFDAKDLWKEALAEGIKYSHSIYDMYYAILARRNDGQLITNDKVLADITKKMKIDVCI
jgi:predicted nucleic acid-binding protein